MQHYHASKNSPLYPYEIKVDAEMGKAESAATNSQMLEVCEGRPAGREWTLDIVVIEISALHCNKVRCCALIEPAMIHLSLTNSAPV